MEESEKESIKMASVEVSQELKALVNADDVDSLKQIQHLILGRLQDSNAVLSHFNEYSENSFNEVSGDFSKNTHLLRSMKSHLDYIFQKLRSMKAKLLATYPDAFSDDSKGGIVDHRPDLKLLQCSSAGTSSIDTVSATHPLKPLLDLLRTDGKLIMLGAPDLETPAQLPLFPLFRRKSLVGRMCGGIKETQEMMGFAAEHDITLSVEVITMDYVNEAMDCLARGDVRYRFVINIANTLPNF